MSSQRLHGLSPLRAYSMRLMRTLRNLPRSSRRILKIAVFPSRAHSKFVRKQSEYPNSHQFLIADFKTDPTEPALIQTLHKLSIHTVLSAHNCSLRVSIETTQGKHSMSFLDNLEELSNRYRMNSIGKSLSLQCFPSIKALENDSKIDPLILSPASREMRCKDDRGNNKMDFSSDKIFCLLPAIHTDNDTSIMSPCLYIHKFQ